MKIAYFTDTYLPQMNGVTVSIYHSARELRKRGHKVYIFAPKIAGYKDEDADVYRLNSFRVLSSEPEVLVPLPMPNRSYRKIMSLSFDLVHAHGNGAFSLLGYQVARMKGVPYVMTFHTLHTLYTHYILNGKVVTPRMVATAFKIFGNVCSGVISPSEKMKKELIRYGVKKDIEVIPSLADTSGFGSAQVGFVRNMLKIPAGGKILLSVGRLGKEKNFAFLIKAFKKIRKNYPSAHFVVVGRGPEERELRALSKSLRLGKSMHFIKKVDPEDMPKVYADADLFLFSSKTETLGLVVLEAACSGLPLVVVEDDAFDGIATPSNAFILPLSQSGFVDAALRIMTDEGLAKKMGGESRRIGKEYLNTGEIIDKLISYYAGIIALEPRERQMTRIIPRGALKALASASEYVERLFR